MKMESDLHILLLQADKEAQFELKASQVESDKGGGSEANSDFGLCRLAIVPALDLCTKPVVCLQIDLFEEIEEICLCQKSNPARGSTNLRP